MAIGLYGKLPSQGDFVSRRLPWNVTEPWDAWLQEGISQARVRSGDNWNETYLTAPLWRLQLAPGVLGPAGWIGLWFASVDRVGRQFPLLLLEPLPAAWAARYTLIEQDEAFFTVEEVALRALDPRLAFEAFDQLLEGLTLVGSAPMPEARDRATNPVSSNGSRTGAIRLPTDVDAAAALRTAEAAGAPSSCFFTWGNEQHEPVLLRTQGLPPAERFLHFLDGGWD